jgi:hypothetical protein
MLRLSNKKSFYPARPIAQLLPNTIVAPKECGARCQYATILRARQWPAALQAAIAAIRPGESLANPLK